MNLVLGLAVGAVIVVLVFDYTNGFHDAANIVATMIASRAMAPAQAVVLVGVFEFLGPLLGGTAVANTIGKFVQLDGVPEPVALSVLLCGLLGAITWNLLTWWKGIPSSSSHALVGGLIGAVVLATGLGHVVWGFSELVHSGHFTGVTKVLLALVLSPLLGFWVAFVIQRLMRRLLAGARPRIGRDLRRAQFLTASGLAFSHGANDAQKSMGILTLVLLLGRFTPTFEVPVWVMFACATAIVLGILSGGWRIVRTMGLKITKLKPVGGFCAETAGALTLFGATALGVPVSTTHTITGSIVGVGSVTKLSAVRWGVAGRIVWAWLLTIPCSAFIAAVTWVLAEHGPWR